jgi:hypothetical protein
MFDIGGPTPRDTWIGYEHFYPQSPLRIVNDSKFLDLAEEVKSSTYILRDAFNNFDTLCTEAFDSSTVADKTETFRTRRDISWKLLTQEAKKGSTRPTTYRDKVKEIIRLTAQIHFRACALGVPHDNELNWENMRKIHGLIREVHFRFWKVAHYVYIWVYAEASSKLVLITDQAQVTDSGCRFA